jgi:hypothetical protein
MGGAPQTTRRPEESASPGYRAQRLVGLFGNPIIAQLMATLAQSRTGGAPNVSATTFAGPGGSPVIDIGALPPSMADLENAVPISATPASRGGMVTDPIIAAVLAAFRDLIREFETQASPESKPSLEQQQQQQEQQQQQQEQQQSPISPEYEASTSPPTVS